MPAESLNIDTVIREDSVVIHLRGAADTLGLNTLKAALDHVRRNGIRRVVVECSGLKYANSSALGHLAAFRRQMYVQGGRVVLAGVRGPVEQSLRLLRMDKVFRVYPDLDAALENINRDTVIR